MACVLNLSNPPPIVFQMAPPSTALAFTVSLELKRKLSRSKQQIKSSLTPLYLFLHHLLLIPHLT